MDDRFVSVDWSGEKAISAAALARSLISARTTLPAGSWSGSDPEAGTFLSLLEEICTEVSQDAELLRLVIGSLAGHAFLFAELAGRTDLDGVRQGLEVAYAAAGGRGWIV